MRPFVRQPLWYKDAVIYEVHVRGFRDSDDDGIGDFRGLIEKLDYIRDLGVTAIWLLPFYPSPLRDDGYDISDYRTVNPAYGTLEIFREFLDEAHARGLYVITEVVINHTSDRHPWFQRARVAPPGSPERDFYVWSHGKAAYGQARVIFQDFEPSNWTWDPVARAHYWHRFYHHQPDLNFDNPAVHDAVLSILDYWLEMGVDGLRLDAIPYLYEREGTNCENLPETHAFLRKLSAHVRARFENRMLLAEANQWPEDAAAYFGNGDSCDMAFHFPLMTRLYMAVESEDRFPVLDILDQTPAIPDACQWAIFLRNHDELTLEMVTDEERDYMIRVFAKDRRARVNLGIRRRLAPLLGNSRRKIELMNALLFSMPGTPVIYYGDEIGMGDNIYLGDRDGVRTPMQWNPDRNAGFSRASAQRLYLPVIAATEHHYEAVNVEAQEANPSSLLWWMRTRLRLRQAHPVFGRGTIRFLKPENGRVLAFIRESDEEAVLVVANLSQNPQAAHLELSGYRGAEPVELTGGTRFPVIGETAWPVTLGGHDCLWFQLRRAGEAPAGSRLLPDAGEWADWDALADSLAASPRAPEWLVRHVSAAPWFAGRQRVLDRMRVSAVLSSGVPDAALVVLRADFLQGEPEDYGVWLAFVRDDDPEEAPPAALAAKARVAGVSGRLGEAQHLSRFRASLIARLLRMLSGEAAPDSRLRVRALAEEASEPLASLRVTPRTVTRLEEDGPGILRIEAGGRLALRWFVRLHPEERPGTSLIGALKRRFPKARVPTVLARVEGNPAGSRRGEAPYLFGTLQRHAPADRSAGDLATEGLQYFLRGAATSTAASAAPSVPLPAPRRGLLPPRLDFQTLSPDLQERLGGTWSAFVFQLGERLADLHRGLARLSGSGNGLAAGGAQDEFAPEAFGLLHQHSLSHAVRVRLRRALEQPDRVAASIAGIGDTAGLEEARLLAGQAHAALPAWLGRIRQLTAAKIDGQRLRVHGDPRLDRILFTGKDFVFAEFDGPPWLPASDRAFRASPLHDLAALLRELSRWPGVAFARHPEWRDLSPHVEEWAGEWAELSAGLLLDGYLDTATGEKWLPRSEDGILLLAESFMLERLAHEVQGARENPERAADALRELARGAISG